MALFLNMHVQQWQIIGVPNPFWITCQTNIIRYLLIILSTKHNNSKTVVPSINWLLLLLWFLLFSIYIALFGRLVAQKRRVAKYLNKTYFGVITLKFSPASSPNKATGLSNFLASLIKIAEWLKQIKSAVNWRFCSTVWALALLFSRRGTN